MKHHLPTDTRQPPTARACAAFIAAYRARRATPNYEALTRAICERWPLDPEQTARFARLALAGRAEMLDPRAPQWRAAAALLDVSLADALGPALSAVRPLPPERAHTVEEVAPAPPLPSTEPMPRAPQPPSPGRQQAAWVAEASANLSRIMAERGLRHHALADMIAEVSPDRSGAACRVALTDALRARRVWSWIWPAACRALRIKPSDLCAADGWRAIIAAEYSASDARNRCQAPQHVRMAVKAAHVAAVRELERIMRERNISTSDLLSAMVATGRVTRDSAKRHAYGLYGLRRGPSPMWSVAAEAVGVSLSDISPCAAWVALASGQHAHVPGSAHMTECAARAAAATMSLVLARSMSLRSLSGAVAAVDPRGNSWRKWYSTIASVTGPKRPTVSPMWPAIAAALGVNLSDLCADPIWLREQPTFRAKT